jgi:PAS domain-containing protein
MPVSDIAASDIVETVPSALIILDRRLNITLANRAFYQMFRTSADETEGCHIYDLGNRQWNIPALRTLLESVIPDRASVEGSRSSMIFRSSASARCWSTRVRSFVRATMTAPSCSPSRMSATSAARQESKRNWQLTQSIVDTIRDPLVVLEDDMTIVTASKAFLTMFGITEAQARGRRVSELGQRQWDVPALRRLMEKVLPVTPIAPCLSAFSSTSSRPTPSSTRFRTGADTSC